MRVITPGTENVVTTPNATMTRLAAPSLGATELATWRARMEAGQQGPVHAVDREQIWVVLSGTLAITYGDDTTTASAGDAVIVPAHTPRRFGTTEGPVEVLVSMRTPASVETAEGEKRTLPWAE